MDTGTEWYHHWRDGNLKTLSNVVLCDNSPLFLYNLQLCLPFHAAYQSPVNRRKPPHELTTLYTQCYTHQYLKQTDPGTETASVVDRGGGGLRGPWPFSGPLKITHKQEYIPVGCGGCLPRGMSAQGASALGFLQPPVNRMTGGCKNITLLQLRCGRQKNDRQSGSIDFMFLVPSPLTRLLDPLLNYMYH